MNQSAMKSENGKRNPWRTLEKFPPVLVRLLARRPIATKHVRAVSDEEIAISAGLPLSKVKHISKQAQWSAMPIGDARDSVSVVDLTHLIAMTGIVRWHTFIRVLHTLT